MKRTGLVCLLFLLAHASLAQVFTIKEVRDTTYMFPVIQSSQRPEVAKKINAVLGKDWEFDMNARNPFENFNEVMAENFTYSVYAMNERIISMQLDASYSACGLHINRFEYNLDSRTGAPIDINKVLGAEGLTKLKKSLAKRRKDSLKDGAADTTDYHWKEYKECVAKAGDEAGLDSRLKFNDQSIVFWSDYCIEEGTSYDYEADRGHGPFEYSLGQLLPMLTPYGYSLFVNSATGPIKSLLRGSIDGKYPISLTLLPSAEGDGIAGMIVYDRVGTPINITGTMNGNQIIFHELDDSKKPISDIELIWDGAKLTGSFTNLKSKKQMPFVASVVK